MQLRKTHLSVLTPTLDHKVFSPKQAAQCPQWNFALLVTFGTRQQEMKEKANKNQTQKHVFFWYSPSLCGSWFWGHAFQSILKPQRFRTLEVKQSIQKKTCRQGKRKGTRRILSEKQKSAQLPKRGPELHRDYCNNAARGETLKWPSVRKIPDNLFTGATQSVHKTPEHLLRSDTVDSRDGSEGKQWVEWCWREEKPSV